MSEDTAPLIWQATRETLVMVVMHVMQSTHGIRAKHER